MTPERLLAILIEEFGKDGRVYSVSFDEQGCHISVIATDTGKFIARYTLGE